MVDFLRNRIVALSKVASRSIQVAVVSSKNMGSSYSRSYSPNSGQRGSTSDSHASISSVDNENFVEQVVCNKDDLQENEMKVFDIGEDGKVLLVKQRGEFHALGTKCTHYGAPLVSGALGDGRLRCQWHGACFNIKTGDIEDFPGFDSLPCYKVTVGEKGAVKVRAKISDLKNNKRIKEIGSVRPCDDTAVVIVGGGPSGATCAETLRSEGFSGRITIVAKENYLPYDRIKVSKIGTVTEIEKLQARTQEYYDNAKIEILKGVEAVQLNTENRNVYLSNGNMLQYSALYLATGSVPNVPDIPGIDLKNIFTVRNFDDAIKILETLGSEKDQDLVILGLSFIGLEVGAACCAAARSTTVVGRDSAPLARVFGAEIGAALQRLFSSRGVRVETGVSIARCEESEPGAGRVGSVQLTDGRTLPCSLLVLGTGAAPATGWLADSGLARAPGGALRVDERLRTSAPNVFAGGDIAHAPVFAAAGAPMSIGHVGLAQYHGRVAALSVLHQDAAPPLRTVPYFWTVLFGKSIRFAGALPPPPHRVSTLVDGDLDELKFLVFFLDEADKVVAVATCMRDPIVSQFAELTHQGKALYRKDLEADLLAWTHNIH